MLRVRFSHIVDNNHRVPSLNFHKSRGTPFDLFTTTSITNMEQLQHVFEAFASFGTGPSKEMDNSHFSKMLKETKIMDAKTFTSTDADLLFNKVKAKGERKINFVTFRDHVIPEIAAKKKTTPEAIATTLAHAAPQSSGTKADAVKFHDDKSQYTGVYKAGGPSNVDRDPHSLAGVVDRRVENDIRGATNTQAGSTAHT
ncbi:Hypothetical protein, putative [Bodo saltans]|uniref:P25-alpha family protein n=1 Tax=Bodo saltans TaxID=75058 RepID=A0A0S4IQF6_BODSA|nr:Hypothetical protein, putative [Bodo saltans]|eukprot:CUE71550.1 Hypothetical protein, putative [Bodo saltans]